MVQGVDWQLLLEVFHEVAVRGCCEGSEVLLPYLITELRRLEQPGLLGYLSPILWSLYMISPAQQCWCLKI
jgi:hypothetical protein